MAKGKFTAGSLNAMVSSVRGKKISDADASRSSLARSSREQNKNQDLADSSSSSESSDNSGSESDVDVEAERKKWAAKVASKNKPAEPKVNGTKSTPAKPTPDAAKRTTKAQTTSGSESSSDSDSESDSSSTDPKKTSSSNPVAKQTPATESESESSSESDSESEETSDKEDAAQPAKADASSKGESDSDNTSSSDSEGDDDTTSSAASKSKNRKKDSASDSRAIARVNGDAATAESDSQVARPLWLNNSDFMLRKASSDNPGKEVADFFSNTNLDGKQLWYFTAPASLPITVLKDMEIDLAKVTSGGPLLKHEGDDYGLDLEPLATNTQIQLLIPSHGGEKYTSLNRGIDSTVHLRRMAKFGPGGEVGATASSEYAPQPKPIRQQPQGLKVHFTPIGVPSPQVSEATKGKAESRKASTPRRSAISKPSPESDSESSSSSDSEADSDVEMANASEVPLPTAGATKSALKRKHAAEEQPSSSAAKNTKSEAKATKKPKSTPSRLLSGKKETPVQPPNLPHLAPASTSTPSKQSASKSKDRKDKPTKTPKGTGNATKSPVRTPVPPPTYLGMTR